MTFPGSKPERVWNQHPGMNDLNDRPGDLNDRFGDLNDRFGDLNDRPGFSARLDPRVGKTVLKSLK